MFGDDDDDELTRRELMALGGTSAFAVGLLTADSEAGELMPVGGSGGVSHTGTFGDWELAIVTDWSAYEPKRYPVIGLDTASEELRLFLGDVSLPARTRGKTMETIITDDLSSIDIQTFPTLIFDTGSNQARLYQEGDL